MANETATLVIGAAEPDYVMLLMQLIRELAQEEKFPFELTVGLRDLSHGLFGPGPSAEAVIAEFNSDVVGFAVFYETLATSTGRRGMHLDAPYIWPAYQGRGFGRQLLGYVATLAKARQCARLEWWSTRSNSKAMAFYDALVARRLDELVVYWVQEADISTLATQVDLGVSLGYEPASGILPGDSRLG